VTGLVPLRPSSLAEMAAEAIRNLIASGELQGGQRLVEAQIAERLNVSRGPVRDAFRQLKEEGLLQDVPRRGTYVVSLTADDVRDLLDLRAGLETRAARLVIERRKTGDLGGLEAGLVSMRSASAEGDSAGMGAADYGFHEALCNLSGSSRLHSVFVLYQTELRLLLRSDEERLYAAGVDVTREHEVLLDALKTGDPRRAEDAFRSHVEEARDRLADQLTTQSHDRYRRRTRRSIHPTPSRRGSPPRRRASLSDQQVRCDLVEERLAGGEPPNLIAGKRGGAGQGIG
jgi:GntR family transcriptional regulator of gluconate operon